jgi:hypothetical protein
MTNFLESLLKGGAKKSRKSKTSGTPKGFAARQKRLVWNGVLAQTRSGLKRSDLAESASGQIVSKKKQANGRKRMATMVRQGTAAAPFTRKSRR